MSKFNFNIPDKINVGYQNRSDTYTGKLAFVVYTDKKGKLRKETSWNGWRDQKIDPDEFDNEPTDGFVLNKKVGDGRYGWNPRKAWVRVYDPRGFEFEISVNNLVFILEECSSIKGKGIEGEMVYAWDGAELLLLPTSSQEYKESIAFKKVDQGKVYKKDIQEGCMYLTKENEEVMYLGKINCWFYDAYNGSIDSKKQHVFFRPNYQKTEWENYPNPYYFENGFTKLSARITQNTSDAFASEFDNFKNSKWGSGPVEIIEKKNLKNLDHYDQYYLYLKVEEGDSVGYKAIELEQQWQYNNNKQRQYYRISRDVLKLKAGESLSAPRLKYRNGGEEKNISDIDDQNIVRLFVKTENGAQINLSSNR